MVYAFSEEEKQKIEIDGLKVVEFKRYLRDFKIACDAIAELLLKIKSALNLVYEIVENFIDNLCLVAEEINEAFGRYTTSRYKVVKALSKCTGIEKQNIWKMTRHTRLARSCC